MRWIVWPLLATGFLLLLAACEDADDDTASDMTPAGTMTPMSGETPGDAMTPADDVCQPNPDPATPDFLVIDQPAEGDTVTSPATVSGQVLAFEATYQVSIFDAAGDPIVETFGTAASGVELSPFSIDVEFEVDEPTPACIWVYEESAMTGEPTHVGQVPVTLAP